MLMFGDASGVAPACGDRLSACSRAIVSAAFTAAVRSISRMVSIEFEASAVIGADWVRRRVCCKASDDSGVTLDASSRVRVCLGVICSPGEADAVTNNVVYTSRRVVYDYPHGVNVRCRTVGALLLLCG